MTDAVPTKEQIKAICDVPSLKGLRDDLDLAIAHIEADLEFRDGSDEWSARARHSLAFHRYALGYVLRRIKALEVVKSSRLTTRPTRARADNDDNTNAVLDGKVTVEPSALSTIESVDRALAMVAEHVGSVHMDREDEVDRPASERDEAFLIASKGGLTRLAALRQSLTTRRKEIVQAQRDKVQAERDTRREALFIQAARETLGRDEFMRLWDRVDRMEALGMEASVP